MVAVLTLHLAATASCLLGHADWRTRDAAAALFTATTTSAACKDLLLTSPCAEARHRAGRALVPATIRELTAYAGPDHDFNLTASRWPYMNVWCWDKRLDRAPEMFMLPDRMVFITEEEADKLRAEANANAEGGDGWCNGIGYDHDRGWYKTVGPTAEELTAHAKLQLAKFLVRTNDWAYVKEVLK